MAGLPGLFEDSIQIAKRLANPFFAKKADELVESGANIAKTVGNDLTEMAAGETPHTWLRKGEPVLQSTYRQIIDDFHSPDMVLGRHEAGRRILDSATHWDLEGNKAMEPIMTAYMSTIKNRAGFNKFAKGGQVDQTVFESLENPAKAALLDDESRPIYDFLKGNYEFTANQRIRSLAGNEQMANRILKMANRDVNEVEIADFTADQLSALSFAKSLKKNYAPHVFDKEQLMERFQRKVEEFSAARDKTSSLTKKEFFEGKVKDYEASLEKLAGGKPLTWETLPKEFVFDHQKVRTGADEYVNSAMKSFESYIVNWRKAMFDDPAVKEMSEHFKDLPLALRPYAKWFIREFAGYNNKSAWDRIAGQIASLQYMRTLGLNPRSAVMNLTQQLNTVVDAGVPWALKGWRNMFSPKIKQLWEKSGLASEIPNVMTDEVSPYMTKMEKIKRVTGFLFNMMEGANRKHAFSSYYTKAIEKMGLQEEEAIKFAIDGVHKTQFQYGRVGMPKALRTPAGKVFGQFTSYSIKQLEFLHKLAREDPKRLIGYMGASGIGTASVATVLGADISNAVGIPMNFAEGIELLRSLSKTDFEDFTNFDEAYAHGQMVLSGGTGILPTSIGGPTGSSLMDIARGLREGKGAVQSLTNSLMPVQWNRVIDTIKSIQDRLETGSWNVIRKGEKVHETTGARVAMEATVARSAEHTKKSTDYYKQQIFDKLDTTRKHQIAEAIVSGRTALAEKMMQRYHLVPSNDMLAEAMMKKYLPRDIRKRWIASKARQDVRDQANE